MRLQKDTKVELMKGVPLFAGCSKAELQKIAAREVSRSEKELAEDQAQLDHLKGK